MLDGTPPERQSADAILEKGSAILRKMVLLRIIGCLDKAVDVPFPILTMCKNVKQNSLDHQYVIFLKPHKFLRIAFV